MKLIEQTEKYVVDTEEQAIEMLQEFKEDAAKKGYILGASGYTYKTRKSKGELYLVKITKVLGGIWDDFE